MNQMVSNLYTSATPKSASSTTNGTEASTTKAEEDEQQPTKRKESSEKPSKQAKKKRYVESLATNDLEGPTKPLRGVCLSLYCLIFTCLGPDVEYSTTTFADFAASDSFKEVNGCVCRNT